MIDNKEIDDNDFANSKYCDKIQTVSVQRSVRHPPVNSRWPIVGQVICNGSMSHHILTLPLNRPFTTLEITNP